MCDSSFCVKKSWETPNTAEIFVHTKPDGFSAYCVPGQVLVLSSMKVAGARKEGWGWECPPETAHAWLCSWPALQLPWLGFADP